MTSMFWRFRTMVGLPPVRKRNENRFVILHRAGPNWAGDQVRLITGSGAVAPLTFGLALGKLLQGVRFQF